LQRLYPKMEIHRITGMMIRTGGLRYSNMALYEPIKLL
jgi:hypothetical protein